MTKQPTSGVGEEENTTAADQDPKPDPKHAQHDNTNENIEDENTKSANGSNKTRKSVHWSQALVTESSVQRITDDRGSNPYLAHSPTPASNSGPVNTKNNMGNVKDVLGRWGKKVGEATKKAEDIAGNTWQHLKTSPSIADAALGRIAQGTKVLAEGGYGKIFRQTFEADPEEQLQNSFACYLSTSAGPVMGVLYLSTAKLAFCSDNPIPYKIEDKAGWSYYKVIIPFQQLKTINPSSSRTNPLEKYIQVISIDNHEFWFMGFLNYTGAVNCLQESIQAYTLQV